MLNFIYYPISWILGFWRDVLSLVMDPHSGYTWVLSIILLTMTIKALLVKPMITQLRSSRKMQELQPKMKEIRDKYKNDKTRQSQELQKFYKESGMNPLAGCLPMLAQIPVFIGLFHVLRMFNRTEERFGSPGLTVEENRNIPNYSFSVEDVQSFLDADVFGVPLSAFISMSEDAMQTFGADFTRFNIIVVAVPLVLTIATLTHLHARFTVGRHEARRAAGNVPQPAGDNAEMMQMQMGMMNKMMLWVMPAITLATGFIWTIGLLFYMLTNTIWTFVQTRIIYGKMDREEEAEEEAKREAKRSSAPAPAARKLNKQTKKQRKNQAQNQSQNPGQNNSQSQAQSKQHNKGKKK